MLNEDILHLWMDLVICIAILGLFEIAMMMFTFGFVTMFFVSQYEWDRLRRDFDLYWPQMVYDHYGPQGRIVWLIGNIIAFFLFTVFGLK